MSPESYEAITRKVVRDLLDAFPDSKHVDETWRHAWNELSDDAQKKVKIARTQAESLLTEEID